MYIPEVKAVDSESQPEAKCVQHPLPDSGAAPVQVKMSPERQVDLLQVLGVKISGSGGGEVQRSFLWQRKKRADASVNVEEEEEKKCTSGGCTGDADRRGSAFTRTVRQRTTCMTYAFRVYHIKR